MGQIHRGRVPRDRNPGRVRRPRRRRADADAAGARTRTFAGRTGMDLGDHLVRRIEVDRTLRHRRAEGEVSARDRRGRTQGRDLVYRAGRRHRSSGRPLDHCREGRWRLGAQWREDLELVGARRRLPAVPGPHRQGGRKKAPGTDAVLGSCQVRGREDHPAAQTRNALDGQLHRGLRQRLRRRRERPGRAKPRLAQPAPHAE